MLLRPLRLPFLLAATLGGCGSAHEATTRTPPMLEIGRPAPQATAVVSLPRQLPAGAPLSGRVPPGSLVTANGEPLPVAADGRIEWPLPAGITKLQVRVQRPDARVIVQQIEVVKDAK